MVCLLQARGELEDVKTAIFHVQQQSERRNQDRTALLLPSIVLAYCGRHELLNAEQKARYDELSSGEARPAQRMRTWPDTPGTGGPPKVPRRAPPPPPVK